MFAIAEPKWCQRIVMQVREMLAKQGERVAITSQNNIIALAEMLHNQRDASRSVTQPPIKWSDKDFHRLL